MEQKNNTMDFKVEYFKENFVKAIRAGIYGIYVRKDDKDTLLYIGESVFVLERCSAHLFEITKKIGYLGFTEDTLQKLQDIDATLVFKLIELNENRENRKAKEKEYIQELEPLMQSQISDRVKPVDEMIRCMENLLNE